MVPAFSVVLPTYNRSGMLARAIQSVLDQTYGDFELIVVDDASPDDTSAVVESWHDPRIVYLCLEKNGGPSAARNAGIRCARGKYIAFLDDDDEYLPDLLAEVYRAMEAAPDSVGFVGCGIRVVETTRDGRTVIREQLPRKIDLGDREQVYLACLERLPFGTGWGMAVRPRCFQEVGLFDENLRVDVDRDLITRLAHRFDFEILPQVLVQVRRHTRAKVSVYGLAKAQAHERIIQKNAQALRSHRRLWADWHYKTGWLYYRAGERAVGRRFMLRGLGKCPWHLKSWAGLILYEASGSWAPGWHSSISGLLKRLRGTRPDAGQGDVMPSSRWSLMLKRMQTLWPSAIREAKRTLNLGLAFLISRVSRDRAAAGEERCWLIGGSSGLAYTDNGAALHKYLVEHHPELRVYWVINRDSPDVEKAKRIGPVLYHQNLDAYVHGLSARVQIISHGLADVPTCGSSLSKQAVKVRLGHGLTALKRTGGSPLRSVEAKNRGFDLVPVSSEFERQHKLEWGILPESLVITGLPRFDELVRKAEVLRQGEGAAGPARILYMPTWRDWLPRGEAEFRASEFYQNVRAYLFHPDLHALLERHDAVMDVHLHIIMQRHASTLARDLAGLTRVRVLPPEVDLQDALARSRLLITDYSSVAWDFLYLDRPVLFYQFDVDEFNGHRGGYVEMEDLFGPVAHDPDTAVRLTGQLVESDFDAGEYRSKMGEWQGRAFCYRDTRNCERVVQAILARLDGR